MVHVLLKPCLENFEHYFTSECNCAVVWAFFGIALCFSDSQILGASESLEWLVKTDIWVQNYCPNLGSLCISAKKKYRDRVMGEKERVTLSLCQTGEHSRLVPQELCQLPSWWVVFQTLSHVWLFATPRTATLQASLFFTLSLSLLKLMPIESVMPSNHLTFCCPLLLLPSICPSIRVFSNELALPGE